MIEVQIAHEIGLMGKNKAVYFLRSLLAVHEGNITQASQASEDIPVARPMTPEEDKASAKQAKENWNDNTPSTSEQLYETAVNAILVAGKVNSGSLRANMGLAGDKGKGQWMWILEKLSRDLRFRAEGKKSLKVWIAAV